MGRAGVSLEELAAGGECFVVVTEFEPAEGELVESLLLEFWRCVFFTGQTFVECGCLVDTVAEQQRLAIAQVKGGGIVFGSGDGLEFCL